MPPPAPSKALSPFTGDAPDPAWPGKMAGMSARSGGIDKHPQEQRAYPATLLVLLRRGEGRR